MDQVSPTLEPVTHSVGEEGVIDKKSNQSGSSKPHPGTSDPIPGRWGELRTRKLTKEDQVSPTIDPVNYSLGEGEVIDQNSSQCGSSKPHPGTSDPIPGGGGSYGPEKKPMWTR